MRGLGLWNSVAATPALESALFIADLVLFLLLWATWAGTHRATHGFDGA